MILIIILLLLLINAILAAYEMALASVSKTKLSILAQENKKGASAALFMKERIEGSLAVIQIGITLVGALAAASGGASADEVFSPVLQNEFAISKKTADILSVLFFVIPLSFTTIVFAELVPKTFAIKNKEIVVLILSPVIKILYQILYPIVMVMEKIVNAMTKKKFHAHTDESYTKKTALEELKTATAVASSSRLFGKIEERIVLSSAFFSIRTIKEIQVPIKYVYILYADASIADTFVKAHFDMHTRFPVCEKKDDNQSIIGYLNFKDIFIATKTIPEYNNIITARSIMRPIIKMDSSIFISTALQKMTKEHQHIALVTEKELITGIITLEDIFEEMVGEIEDEYDYSPEYIRKFGNGLVASASAKMQNVYKEFNIPVPFFISSDLTVEKWSEQKLGKIPGVSEVIFADGLKMETRKFRRNKLMEAMFHIDTASAHATNNPNK